MKNQRLFQIILSLLISFTCGLVIGGYVGKKRGIPFIRKEGRYSIGIYTGESPFTLMPSPKANNPILTYADITDIPAAFVADPFMVRENEVWYLFFEVMNERTNQGDIGLATSDNGFDYTYKQIVLDEPFHLSYPYIFKWDNEYYMVPESHQAYSVRLYKAVDFPTKWSFVKNLFSGNYVDSSIFHHDGRWWIFASEGIRYDVLHLLYADNLIGPWVKHPKSPIVLGDANIARPGGRVFKYDNRLFRYTQDCDPVYGNQVHAFEITKLTIEEYNEKELSVNPILKGSGKGWNAERIHHIDPHLIEKDKWLACVDGYGKFWMFGLGY